jgi:hypothetical protein
MDTVKLGRVEERFADLDYPVTRDDAAAAFADVRVVLADGEANLGRLVSEVGSDSFDGPDELFAELRDGLPAETAGEPGRSGGNT